MKRSLWNNLYNNLKGLYIHISRPSDWYPILEQVTTPSSKR